MNKNPEPIADAEEPVEPLAETPEEGEATEEIAEAPATPEPEEEARAKMEVNGHSVWITNLADGRFKIEPDSFAGPTIVVDSEEDIAKNVPTTLAQETAE